MNCRLRVLTKDAVGLILKEAKVNEHALKLAHFLAPAAARQICQRTGRGKQQQTDDKPDHKAFSFHSSISFIHANGYNIP